jgi:hypothetical protein
LPESSSASRQDRTTRRRRARQRELFDLADDVDDRDSVGTEVRGQLILDRLRHSDEPGLIDVLDDLDADALELPGRLLLELERVGRLLLADLGGGRLDAPFLVVAEGLPGLVANQSRLLLASCWVNDITGATS